MLNNFWNYHTIESESHRIELERQGTLRCLALTASDQAQFLFEIRVKTNLYAPNHSLTLRNSMDGWGRDIYGVYCKGKWLFVLLKENYPRGMEYKFFLDKAQWMDGLNFSLPAPVDVTHDETQVHFQNVAPRYHHGYDNLRVNENEAQQSTLRKNYDDTLLWDVIIIGSGMGGGVLADHLTDVTFNGVKKPRVLVLDAGCMEYTSHVYNLPEGGGVAGRHEVGHYHVAQGDLGMGVQMNLGGRSVFWSGVIPRMQDWEMAHWPAPVAADLRSAAGYPAAEKLMRKHLTFGAFEAGLIADLQAAFPNWRVVNTPRSHHQPDMLPSANPLHPGHPGSFIEQTTGTFSTAELLFDSMSTRGPGGSENLFVNLNHLVTRLEMSADGKSVTGVVCQDLVGHRERIYRGKFVVLAAGSLESPKIALKSGLRNAHPNIGVGITDHPFYHAGNDKLEKGDTRRFYLPAASPYAGGDQHARIFFYPNQPHLGQWFNVEMVLNGRFWRVRHADDEVWAAEKNPLARTQLEMKFGCGSPLDDNNSIQLGNNTEKLEVAMARNGSNWGARFAVKDLCRKLLDFFQVPGVNLDDPGNPAEFNPEWMEYGNGNTVNHAGGSLRMGAVPGARVVDTDLKFENCDNLYACDVSVFPFIPAANPSLTLSALALRLAQHLAAKV